MCECVRVGRGGRGGSFTKKNVDVCMRLCTNLQLSPHEFARKYTGFQRNGRLRPTGRRLMIVIFVAEIDFEAI